LVFALSPTDTLELNELARKLVRTPSTSGYEGEVAQILQDALRAAGLQDVWRDRAGTVVGRLGAAPGRTLLLIGHMDTVEPGVWGSWSVNPYEGAIEQGVLFGRGAADMKGALASMVLAARLLASTGQELNGRVYWAFVPHEEPAEGMAARWLLEDSGITPDYVILGDPTNLGIYLGQRGRAELVVTTRGRSHHAAIPEGGVNAVYAAARLIFGIELLASHLLSDPILGHGTIAVTRIVSGPAGENVIPDQCTLFLDRRLTLGETESRALTEIRQIMKREGVQGEVSIAEADHTTYAGYTARVRTHYPPWLMQEDAPLVRTAVRSVERILGAHPRTGVWRFSTDGTYTMGAAGIPTIGFGPGEERFAHSPDEQVRLSDLALAARAYAQLACDLLR
jgi:putative selenium metabolism hydrolase